MDPDEGKSVPVLLVGEVDAVDIGDGRERLLSPLGRLTGPNEHLLRKSMHGIVAQCPFAAVALCPNISPNQQLPFDRYSVGGGPKKPTM